MVSVYLTYRNSPSYTLAKSLEYFLTNKQVKVFLSPKDKSGDPKAYYPRIKEADVFVCLIAEGTFEPHWIQSEIEHAYSVFKPMIPVYHGNYQQEQATFPKAIQTLLAQEGLRASETSTMDAMRMLNDLVKRIYDAAGKTPNDQPLVPNQYVFLSYSRRDDAFMNRIGDDLLKQGVGVWIDAEGLEPGTPMWERGISDAIRQAGCMVVLLSPDAEQSVWVGRELAMAEAVGKRIFPVLVRGSKTDAIPFRLMTHQWIDARENYAEALQTLVATIRKHLGAG